jgi:uncharacterized protein with HEPN domain
MLENIGLAQSFSQGMTLGEFQADRRTVYAVTRCLEIISEASRRLSQELTKRHSNIDWIKIAASGNIYRHGYQAVRDEILWNTLKDGLGPLKAVVEEELRRLGGL